MGDNFAVWSNDHPWGRCHKCVCHNEAGHSWGVLNPHCCSLLLPSASLQLPQPPQGCSQEELGQGPCQSCSRQYYWGPIGLSFFLFSVSSLWMLSIFFLYFAKRGDMNKRLMSLVETIFPYTQIMKCCTSGPYLECYASHQWWKMFQGIRTFQRALILCKGPI